MAVCNVELSINEGEIVGLIGPNGSGKTTLFNLIAGFLRPDSGRVRFRGEDITGFKPHRVCERGIARIFQLVKPFSQMTTVQNVMVGRLFGRNRVHDLEQANKESKKILDFVGLKDKESISAESLILADRKRLELARALASEPRLLLLDELMAGLNPTETEAAMRLIEAVRDSGITVIMVEHIIKAVIGISDRLIVLSAGEKIVEGIPQQVINNQQVIEAYLGKGEYA